MTDQLEVWKDRVDLWLPAEQLRCIKQIARQAGMPTSALIRELIDEGFRTYEPKRTKRCVREQPSEEATHV